MDWNSKLDWENLVSFNSKVFERPKQPIMEWGIDEEVMMSIGLFDISEGKGSSSGSEVAPGSSARSSISVCTDSPFKEVMKNNQAAFGAINAFSGDLGRKCDLGAAEQAESSSPLDSSVGSGESLIGLKLGKRMYFENQSIGGNTKSPTMSGIPLSSTASTVKKMKLSVHLTPTYCQVEGCNIDLSSAKQYHRKHRVCASHSKSPKVVVNGLERRFCQQCSRFHSLSEFDEKKRSCRRRLSDHNARRRKPQLDPIQFNTMRLPSSFSEGKQQMSFVSNNVPLVYSKTSMEPTWESTCSPKFTTTKGCMLEFGKTGSSDEKLPLPGNGLPHATSIPFHGSNRISPFKGSKAEVWTRGPKEPACFLNMSLAPDVHRALSLLSNDSWGSVPPSNNSLGYSINVKNIHQPLMQGFFPSYPQASSEFCQTGSSTATANDTSHFPLVKAPYDHGLYADLFN